MTLTLNVKLQLSQEEQERLTDQAQRQGLTLERYIQSVVERLVRPHDARTLRALPREERNRLLSLQAEEAAPLYEQDLARPVAARELTAFTALNGEDVHEHTP